MEAAAFLLEKSEHLIQCNYIAPTRPEMTAGTTRIRASALFSDLDFDQLFKTFLETGQDEREPTSRPSASFAEAMSAAASRSPRTAPA